MDRRYCKLNIGKRGSKLIRQHRYYNVFGAEVVGVNEIYAELLSVKKTVVFYIACNIGITACTDSIHKARSPGTAHYCKLFYGPSCIMISQSVSFQSRLAQLEKALKLHWMVKHPNPSAADSISVFIDSARLEPALRIYLQSRHKCVIHASLCYIEVCVHTYCGYIIAHKFYYFSSDKIIGGYALHSSENYRMMRYDEIRAKASGLVNNFVRYVE